MARHDGRVVFVRYALPGETVRVAGHRPARVYWHAEVVEVLEPSPDRVDSLCPIAGVDGAGCCDLAFAEPAAARRIKGEVVANQLARLGGYRWRDEAERRRCRSVELGATGWRTRVRLERRRDGRRRLSPLPQRGPGAPTSTARSCPTGMLDRCCTIGAGRRCPVARGARRRRRPARGAWRVPGAAAKLEVVEGGYEAVQRVGDRSWQVPVTAFWQAHRDAATPTASWSPTGRGSSRA